MPPKEANSQSADQQSCCEFGKTLYAVGECPRAGEVQFDGSLLCEPHAELLRLEVREDTLLDRVFEMDKWLDGPNNQADQLHWRRVLHQRDETVEQLRFNHRLIEAHTQWERDQQP